MGGAKAKAKGNIAAIKLLKQIEAEGRQATTEEQHALVRFVGWGGLPQMFDLGHKDFAIGTMAAELKALLTPAEYDAAKASTPNAHYTSPTVIRAMYDALARLGFKGGKVLEPSMGVGHFFGLMPTEMRGRSHLMGVELDSITGRIATLLYPGADVRVTGFEKVKIADGAHDVVASNVPFGDYKVFDPKYNKLGFTIHNYFFAKGLDTVRPGGIVAFITSRYTMDQGDSAVRKYLAERADLIGAIRLPNTAFKGNAGTEVTTDVIFLQKRAPGKAAGGEPWVETEKQPGDWRLNAYYVKHPYMMLGEMKLEGTMYGGNEPTLAAPASQDLSQALAYAVRQLPAGIYTEPAHASTIEEELQRESAQGVQEGRFEERGGGIQVVENGQWADLKLPATAVPRIKKLLEIRDATREVIRAQLADASDTQLAAAQKKLGKAYDQFVAKYGSINKEVRSFRTDKKGKEIVTVLRPNLRYFDDIDAPLVWSLEHYDGEKDTAKKAEIFTQRTIRRPQPPAHVDAGADAMLLSLDAKGTVDFDYMSGLTGKSRHALLQELQGLVFEDPETGQYEPADAYLSGNVRKKLVQARAAAARDARFADQVKALEAVQPTDLLPSEIDASLGAPWIPPADIEAFVTHMLGAVNWGKPRVSHFQKDAVWTVDVPHGLDSGTKAVAEWGTGRVNAAKLIEMTLNQGAPTVYDSKGDERIKNTKETIAAQEKQQLIKDEFRKWLFADDERAGRLVRKYNDEMNNMRVRQYDGRHLTLAGASMAITPHPHQLNAVYRILQSGNTLLAHVVGAGKTYTMAIAGMEGRRLGVANKPMYAVPNHMLGQFSREFLQMYPAARILVAQKEDFAADRRKLFMAKAATGNWDAIVVTHSSFGKLPMSRAFEEEYLKTRLREYEKSVKEEKANKGKRDNRMLKQIEKGKKRLEERLQKLRNREAKDEVLTFEELGVDQLFVDEAHLFKNLDTPTKMERISLPNSQRAQDLYMKTTYLDRQSPGRGVVFATGTPISNSVAEMFTMQRYLQPRALAERGLEHFDAWVAAFGDWVTALELKPEGGGFRMNTRFARFKNMPELSQVFRQVADVQTQEELKLPVPKLRGGKAQVAMVPASTAMKNYIQTLVERAEKVRGKQVEPEVDNMLKITGDGRRAALDMRLVDPMGGEVPDSKLDAAAEKIHGIWKATAAEKSAQMVFSDLGTPKSEDRFDVYNEIKRKLIDRGVPAKEVAFIHDAKTDKAKEQLFDAVRQGKVRVLIGSTEKMGAGTNVQKRLIAKHDLDAPWRPSDVEQRDGRIIRQGNQNPEVQIYRYITEESFDAYNWQTLETKAKFIDQAMRASAETRSIEDVDSRALSFAEIKALASGDPRIMELAGLEADVQKLSRLEGAHTDQTYRMRQALHTLPREIQTYERAIEAVKKDLQQRQDISGDQFTATIDGTTYTKRTEAGARLNALALERLKGTSTDPVTIGQLGGFPLALRKYTNAMVEVQLEGALLRTYDFAPTEEGDGLGVLQSLERKLRLMEEDTGYYEKKIGEAERNLADAKRLVGQPFERATELAKKRQRAGELSEELRPKENEVGQEPVEGPPSVTGESEEDEGEEPPEGGAIEDDGGTMGLGLPGWPDLGEGGFIKIGKLPTNLSGLYTHLSQTEVGDAILKLLAPAKRGAQAEEMAHRVRAHKGEAERDYVIAKWALRQAAEEFPKLSTPAGLDAADAIETGRASTLPSNLQPIAKALRAVLDDRRDKIRALGTGALEDFNENYLGHIWERGGKPSFLRRLMARRPLEGSKSFLRSRVFPTLREGMDAGFVPITDNLIFMQLLKVREMDRYIAAHRIWNEAKAAKLVQFFRPGAKRPDGYARINDRIATVFGPRTDEGATAIRGEYWAPEPVATILNNALSPGLRGNVLFDALMGAGNVLTQAQLGLSFFHAGFTTYDVMVSHLAMTIEDLMDGHVVQAAKTLPSVLHSPVTNPLRGWQVKMEYRQPGSSKDPQLQTIVNALVRGGLRVEQPVEYQTNAMEKFARDLRTHPVATAAKGAAGAAIGGALGGPLGAMIGGALWSKAGPAALELVSGPIMKHLVPLQKLGVAAELMRRALERLGPKATPAAIDAAAANVVDTVEDRLGQVTYDNYFWNRWLKDAMQLTVRSVGWNWGFVRLVPGGLKEMSAARWRSYAATYTMALTLLTAAVGALVTYLLTGEHPKELKDYIYIRTGRKNADGEDERMVLPSYMRDVAGFLRHPVETLEHKINPLWPLFQEMLHNRDFYGNEIRNEDDPAIQQLQQLAAYMGKTFIPFGVRGAVQEGQQEQGGAVKALPFVGITPAPREVVRSDDENVMANYFQRQGHKALTPEEAEQSQQHREERRNLRDLTLAPASGTNDQRVPEYLREKVRAGEMNARQARQALKTAQEPPHVTSFRRLPLDVAMRTYQAASAERRADYYQLFAWKIEGKEKEDPSLAAKAYTLFKDLPHGDPVPVAGGRRARGNRPPRRAFRTSEAPAPAPPVAEAAPVAPAPKVAEAAPQPKRKRRYKVLGWDADGRPTGLEVAD